MTILMILFGLLLAVGMFFLFTDILKLPRPVTDKAMQSATKEYKNTDKNPRNITE